MGLQNQLSKHKKSLLFTRFTNNLPPLASALLLPTINAQSQELLICQPCLYGHNSEWYNNQIINIVSILTCWNRSFVFFCYVKANQTLVFALFTSVGSVTESFQILHNKFNLCNTALVWMLEKGA